VVIDVNYLKPIIQEEGVFQRLKIMKDYKDIVRGLVSPYFQKKELERLFTDKSMEVLVQDLIQGKGKGLVILLHGAPGVGKTATAETVAMESNKPLFTITCGDLGLVASDVESSLTDILRLAQKWDCVLLLDEADVFLSQRSRYDMKRNSLVSVFLRVLEYYNGLLFLTTNRVGTIDEAFKSRIHMSLYYPPLDQIQTKAIFRLNVNKLRESNVNAP
jgi:SpoVK/Ycf46/Vps4 family AAA+-type ATPase